MTKATTPCPSCHHSDEDHERLLAGRAWARRLHERAEARRREEAEKQAAAPERFQCTCGHPGLGCYCRGGAWADLL